MCFKVHKVVFQGPCCVWSDDGLCGVGSGAGVVVELAVSSDGFFKYICYRHSPHTEFQTSGDTSPAAFYYFS